MRKIVAAALVLMVSGATTRLLGDAERVFQLAKEMEQKKLYAEADSLYREALNQNPSDSLKVEIYVNLADLNLDKLNDPQKALHYLKLAQAMLEDSDPRMAGIHYRLGLVYEKLGKYVDAAQEYQTVVINYQNSQFADEASKSIDRVFSKNIQEYLAIVGGEPITSMELEKRLEEIPPFYRGRFETPEGRKELLERMIDERLMTREAEERKLYLKADVQEKLMQQRARILQNALYEEEVRQKANVTEDEMKKYYEKHKDDFKIPARVTLMRITVENKDTAEMLLNMLKEAKGDSALFDSLARKYSVTPDAKRGGLMYNLTENARPQEIVKKAFEMEEGELSDIIELSDGKFAIIKVIKKQPESIRPFDEVKLSIENKLRREKEKQLFEQLKKRLREKYGVEYVSQEGGESGEGTKGLKKK